MLKYKVASRWVNCMFDLFNHVVVDVGTYIKVLCSVIAATV